MNKMSEKDYHKIGKKWAWIFYKQLGYRIVEEEDKEVTLAKTMNRILRQERKKIMEELKRISVKLMVKGFSNSHAPVARAYNEGIRDLMKEIRRIVK